MAIDEPATLLIVGVGFAAALALGLALTPLVQRQALRRGWVCHPRSDRWSERTVALMGGIAIAVAVFASLGLTALGAAILGLRPPATDPVTGQHLALLLASLVMFIVGVVDDRLTLRPHTKLLAQVLAAVVLVQAGVGFGFTGAQHLDQALTLLWLVGIGNAFNLLDNMDGLCAGVAAVAALFLTLIQVLDGHPVTAVLSASMAGATLAFLRYNFSPARIFMGDGGSLFIGQFVAGAALLRNQPGHSENVVSVVALPALVLLIPIMDTTLVTLARKWARRPVSQGGCDHSSHRLVAIGLSDRGAVLFLYALAVAGGALALAMRWLDWYVGYSLLPLFLLVIGAVGAYLGRVRVYDDADTLGTVLDRTPLPLLAQHRYRRRMLEVAIDTAAISVAYYLAVVLRYEQAVVTERVLGLLRDSLPLVLAAHLVAYQLAGVYRGIWQHTSISDVPRFTRAVSLGLLLSVVLLALAGSLTPISKTVFAINWLLQIGLLLGSRLSFRVLRDLFAGASSLPRRTVLVVGGSDQSDLALRRMRLDPRLGMAPAGVVCEDLAAVGFEIHGTRVMGTSEQIVEIIRNTRFDEAVLVDESYSPECWERIRRACAELGVPTQTIVHRVDMPARP